MSTEPSLELQGSVVSTLKNTGAVSALIGQRVYDKPPAGPTFPYATVGDDQVLQDHAECLEGSVEINSNIHVWSRAIGKVEAKKIAGAIVTALNGSVLSVNGYRLVSIQHTDTRHLDDPDGITSHSVVSFRALIDET